MGQLPSSNHPVSATAAAAPATFSSALARWGGATIFPTTRANSLLDVLHVYHPDLMEAPNSTGYAFDSKRQRDLVWKRRQYYSQWMEDCRIRALIEAADANTPDDLLGGNVFLEMGALDGIRYSNTLALEMVGWRGVLIEANPSNCHQLKDNRRSGRAVNICAGVCAAGGGSLEFELVKSATSRMVSMPLPPDATAAQRAKRIQVPCLPLGQILRDLAVTRLTYFSLDVEGAELSVLRTLDWASVRIDVLQWECNHKSECASVKSLLVSQGMRPIGRNAHDHVWISGEFARRLGNTTFEMVADRACPVFNGQQPGRTKQILSRGFAWKSG
jgi:FkbM family methyltransferase